MKYEYFISYTSKENNNSQICNCTIDRNKEIESCEDIINLTRFMEEQFGQTKIIILNFILLRKYKDKEEN